jgi:hypothetical protein
VSGIAGLFIAGLIGPLWFVSADHSPWKAVWIAAILALAALAGITWYLSRIRAEIARAETARAERRWWAALDAYAKRELDAYAKQGQAKRLNSRRNFHAGPQSQDR